MRKLTATICLTLAVLLGNAGVSWGDSVYTALDANGNGVRIKHQIKDGSLYHKKYICDKSWDRKYHTFLIEGEINKDTYALIERVISNIKTCELKPSLKNRNYCTIYKEVEKLDLESGRRYFEPETKKYNADHPNCIIKTPRLEIYLSSHGGSLKHGIEIGRIFKKFKINTFISDGQRCSSACAIAFLGGEERTILGDGSILFHAPYLRSAEKTDCRDRGQVQILSEYYREMLGSKDGDYALKRTMDFCSKVNGWVLNGDAARELGIVNNKKSDVKFDFDAAENGLTRRCQRVDGTYFFTRDKCP